MTIKKYGIKIETEFDIHEEVTVLNKHTMQLVDFTIDKIEVLLYPGLYEQTVPQVTYKGNSKHSPKLKDVTIGGACGEHYVLFSTYEEAKKALIELL